MPILFRAIDVTKVAQAKHLSEKYRAIIGSSYPNNFISLDELLEEKTKEKILETYHYFTLASESKISVV